MKIPTRPRSRYFPAVLTALVTLLLMLSQPTSTKAVVVPPGFITAVLQVLPAIGTIIGKLSADKKTTPTKDQATALAKMQTDSNLAKTQLGSYAERGQIIWHIVDASGDAITKISSMLQIVSNQTTLTKANLDDLTDQIGFVKSAIDSIVASKPAVEDFDDNSTQLIAIQRVLKGGPYADNVKTAVDRYDVGKQDAHQIQLIEKNLKSLQVIFLGLNEATSAEIKMLADGLSALSAPTVPNSKDKPATDAASKKTAQKAFGNIQALDKPIGDSRITFQKLDIPTT